MALFVVFFKVIHGINENFADRRQLLNIGIVFAPALIHSADCSLSPQPYYGTGHILMEKRCRGGLADFRMCDAGCHAHGFAWACEQRNGTHLSKPCPRKAVDIAPDTRTGVGQEES